MIVADHTHKKLVLAIRGTFSLSEIAVDIAAYSSMYQWSPRFISHN